MQQISKSSLKSAKIQPSRCLCFVFQVALNTEIENLGKSYGGNNLDENLTAAEAKNNHTNKSNWVSEEEFQMCVIADISLDSLLKPLLVSTPLLLWLKANLKSHQCDLSLPDPSL